MNSLDGVVNWHKLNPIGYVDSHQDYTGYFYYENAYMYVRVTS